MKKIFLTVAIAALALFSCNKENTAETNSELVAVQFNNGVITRASGTEWANDDRIGVYMFTTETTTPYGDNSNVEYYNSAVAGETATFKVQTVAKTIYYPLDGTNVDFLAYYPYSSTEVSSTDFIYPVDVNSANQKKPTEIDLLISKNLTDKAVNSAPLAFTFTHALSQLNFVVSSGTGSPDLTGLEITVGGLYNSADYTLTTGDISFDGKTTSDLTVSNESAIIIPQTADLTFTFTTDDNQTGFITTKDAMEFNPGESTTLTFKINRTSVSFEGESTINGWNSVDGYDDEIDVY